MTAASPQTMPTQVHTIPAAVLWPDGARVDPSETIPQNPSTAVADGDTVRIPCASENASVSDVLSLNIWCPTVYHDRLQAVLAPFGARVDADLKPSAGGMADFAAAANAPSLVFFDDLSGCLAATYGDPQPQAATALRPVGDVVQDWRGQSEALLKAVRGAKAHITLIPASALSEQPQITTQAIALRYGLPLDAGAVAQVTPPAHMRGQAPHFALMADAIAQTAPEIGTLLAQLSSESLKGTAYLPQPQSPEVLQRLLIEAGCAREALSQQHDQDLARVETLAETTIQRLRHQVDGAQLSLLERDAQATRLAEEAAQHDAAATYLKEELTRRETTYSSQSAELGVLRATAVTLEAARKATSAKGNRLERDLSGLARNIRMRDERIAGLATALHGYEDEALALREEVAQLRQSTSWRLTAPVRALSRLARKVLRRG